MQIKPLLLVLANIVLVAFSSYKDEALVKWPFCDFKEGQFESLYAALRLPKERIPESPLYCHLLERKTLIPEENFLAIWKEHVKGKDKRKCHDESDYEIEL